MADIPAPPGSESARGITPGPDYKALTMTLFEYQLSQLDRAGDDVAGFLAGCKLCLYQNVIDIGPGNTHADFVANVANFAGYAKAALVYDTPSVADDGTVEVVTHALTFRPSDATVPNVIWGCWIEDSTAAILYFAAQFDGAPLPMQNALQQIIVTVRFRPASDTLVITVS